MQKAQATRNERAGGLFGEHKMKPVFTRRVKLASSLPQRRRRRTGRSAAVGRQSEPSVVDKVVDAIKRSPLALDLPSNHPGLARIASSLVRRGCGCLGSGVPFFLSRGHPRFFVSLWSARCSLLLLWCIGADPAILTVPSAFSSHTTPNHANRRRMRSARRWCAWCASTACWQPRRWSSLTLRCVFGVHQAQAGRAGRVGAALTLFSSQDVPC